MPRGDDDNPVSTTNTEWICELCGRSERLTLEEAGELGWHFCEGDVCPQCHADNIKHHRTNEDYLNGKERP